MDFQTPSHSFSFTSFKRIRLVIPFATISILLLIYSLSTERYPSTSVAHGFSRGHAAASDDTEYVAMCVAHRNQVEDLPEFLRHHYYQHGIRRFYVGFIPHLFLLFPSAWLGSFLPDECKSLCLLLGTPVSSPVCKASKAS